MISEPGHSKKVDIDEKTTYAQLVKESGVEYPIIVEVLKCKKYTERNCLRLIYNGSKRPNGEV